MVQVRVQSAKSLLAPRRGLPFFVFLCGLPWLGLGGCVFDRSGRPATGVDAEVLPDVVVVVCGDGVRDPGEVCDGEDLGGVSCESMDFVGGQLLCTNHCVFDDSQCEIGGDCGNGVVDAPEICDGSQLGGFTCLSETGYVDGLVSCTGSCTLNLADCHTCGNMLVEGPEMCDGAPGGLTCENQGFSGGQIACSGLCQPDLSGCFECGDGICRADLGESHQVCPADCDWVAVEAGSEHTCAISRDGTLWCWGANASGQLGIGSVVSRDLPTLVPGLTGVVTVSAGDFHTCAVLETGTAWCWGANNQGQLGDSSNDDSPDPVQVTGLTNVAAVASGGEHTCARLSGGTLWCWGKNDKGQLGDNSTTARNAPVAVQEGDGLDLALSVTAGSKHTCAVKTDNTPWCWGDKGSGRLGDDSNTDQPTPVMVDPASVSALDVVIEMFAGEKHTCAVAMTGAPWCWGDKADGRIGDGADTTQPVPVPVSMGNVVTMAAGLKHTCALDTSGAGWCWGAGADGQIGDGATSERVTPVAVYVGSGFTTGLEITVGWMHTCALKTDHTIWCWGANDEGQLGDGSISSRSAPVLTQ